MWVVEGGFPRGKGHPYRAGGVSQGKGGKEYWSRDHHGGEAGTGHTLSLHLSLSLSLFLTLSILFLSFALSCSIHLSLRLAFYRLPVSVSPRAFLLYERRRLSLLLLGRRQNGPGQAKTAKRQMREISRLRRLAPQAFANYWRWNHEQQMMLRACVSRDWGCELAIKSRHEYHYIRGAREIEEIKREWHARVRLFVFGDDRDQNLVYFILDLQHRHIY